MKPKALDDKLAGKRAEVKVEILFTLLSEIKGAALNDTLADRQTDEIETLGEPAAQRKAEVLIKTLPCGLRRVDVRQLTRQK